MSVQVSYKSFYVIEGDDLSDGDRAFLRMTSVYVIDGDEAGNAAQRAFARDFSVRLIEGRPAQDYPGIYTNTHNLYEIDGRMRAGGVFTNYISSYVIEGVAPVATDMVLVKTHTIYAVETE